MICINCNKMFHAGSSAAGTYRERFCSIACRDIAELKHELFEANEEIVELKQKRLRYKNVVMNGTFEFDCDCCVASLTCIRSQAVGFAHRCCNIHVEYAENGEEKFKESEDE